MNILAQAYDKLRENGIEVKGRMFRCPFHDDKNPSANLFMSKGRVWFHCFGCGKSYPFEEFLKKLRGEEVIIEEEKSSEEQLLSFDFVADRLNKRFLSLLDLEEDTRFEKERMLALKGLEYLESRGFGREEIERFQIGFLTRELGEQLKDFQGNSWLRDTERECFLVFPIKRGGKVISFQFEDFLNRGKLEKTKFLLQGRSKFLWYSGDEREERTWVVCEGIYDAMSFTKIGVEAIALLGNPSKKEIEELKELKELVLCLDSDEEGKRMQENLKKELYPSCFLLEIELQGVKDANELLQKRGVEGVKEAWDNAKEVDLFPVLNDELDSIKESWERINKQSPEIPGEFSFLREFLIKLYPGLYAVAGMPGVGKTSFLNQFLNAFHEEGIPAVYFLTEEPKHRLIYRTIRNKGLKDWNELKETNYAKLRIIFEMTPEYTAESLKDLVAGIKKKFTFKGYPFLIFVVDSLQALRLSKEKESMGIREKTILKTEYLSYIARDLEIPVLFTSFVARENYNGEPSLAVFKESGDIEYLIDVGIFLKGDSEDLKKKEEEMKISFYVLKNRFGRTGSCELVFNRRDLMFRTKSKI